MPPSSVLTDRADRPGGTGETERTSRAGRGGRAGKFFNRELGQRIPSGLVMFACIMTLIHSGGIPLHLAASVCSVIVTLEWLAIASGRTAAFSSLSRQSVLICCGAACAVMSGVISPYMPLWIGAGAFLLCIGLVRRNRIRAALAALFLVWPFAAFVWLRETETLAAGSQYVLAFTLTTIATDLGSYTGGRLLGGASLSPVSPNKTWSGAIAGFCCAGLTASVVGAIVQGNIIHWAVTGCLISLAAQCGDLLESLAKRSCGVKHTSRLIPGHGGLLDCLDSLMMVSLLMTGVAIFAPDILP